MSSDETLTSNEITEAVNELNASEISSIILKKYPKDALRQRAGGGGKQLTYIEGQTAIRRLIEATGNIYDFHIIATDMRPFAQNRKGNDQFLITVHGRLYVPKLSERGRDNIGVQLITTDGGEDLFKGAVTDCFKRCLMMFGNALELYGDDYENPEVTTATKKLFMDKYKASTEKTLDAATANELAQSKFGRNFSDLKEREVLEWLKDFERTAAVPF